MTQILVFDKFFTPRILLLLSVLVLYVLYFLPSLVVIYQPLPNSDVNASGISAQSIPDVSQKAYLRLGQSIHDIDKCNYIDAHWTSVSSEYLYGAWEHLSVYLILAIPAIVFGSRYVQVYQPSHLSFFLVVVLSFVIMMMIVYLRDDASPLSGFCSSAPAFLIKRAIPFWPAVLLWIGSLSAGIIALCKLSLVVRRPA